MQTEVANMSDKIKKFFAKKKADAKFKLAGPGHRLAGDGSTPSVNQGTKDRVNVPKRVEPSDESRQAALAALARLSNQKRDSPTFNTSLQAVKAQVRKELEAEKLAESSADTDPPTKDVIVSPHQVATGVYFRCPLLNDAVLPRDEWKVNIKKFLYDQLAEERGLTATLIIQSCNTNKEKIKNCVETLCKYLQNIIEHPEDDKYRKIKMSNRHFYEKVLPIEGALDLLLAAGFLEQKIASADGTDEDFLVFMPENESSINELVTLIDALRTAEPIPLELDRNLQVLLPSQVANRTELPPAFYAISAEEIKREHQARLEAIEKSQMLRTKAMREKDAQREMKKYHFAVIRIRFPDGIFLQGTFYVYEAMKEIYEYVRENLEHENLPFFLNAPSGHRLSLEEDGDKSLIDLFLVPATILTFLWDPSVSEEISHSEQKDVYLKPEIMLMVHDM